jgi:hypothetical protein
MMIWAAHVAHTRDEISIHKSDSLSQGNKSLGRQKRRCLNNIKMQLTETVYGGMDWTQQVKDTDK